MRGWANMVVQHTNRSHMGRRHLTKEPAMTSLNSEVTKFLSPQPLKMFIGGPWIESKSGETFGTLDPGQGNVLAKVSAGEAAEVDAAGAAGQEALRKKGWSTKPRN